MTDFQRKTKFFWASIAGAPPEPVEVCTVEGRDVCYTLGCGDPFFLDEADCPVILGSSVSERKGGKWFLLLDTEHPTPLERPSTKEASAAEIRRAEKAYEKVGHHSWRGSR